MAYYRNNKGTYKNKRRYSNGVPLSQASPMDMMAAFGGSISKPTLSQYGLDGIDLERLKREQQEFQSQQLKKKDRQDAWEIIKGLFTVLCFSGPFVLIAGVLALFGKGTDSHDDILSVLHIYTEL